MNTHALLDHHPSVQALNIANNKVNPAKVAHHTRVINARPFTTASAVLAAHKGSRKDAKGARVEVVRHDDNIRAAAVAAQAARSGKFQVTSTTKLAAKKGLPPRAGTQEVPPPPPPEVSERAKIAKVEVARAHDAASLVSSEAESFEPTSSRAESYSDYSCSCCHPRKAPSTTVTYSSAAVNSKRSTAPSAFSSSSVPLSAYENMTSISERIARRGRDAGSSAAEKRKAKAPASSVPSSLTGSMTSSKLRTLEDELAVERQQRRHTEEELAQIKARQELLLSKLSDKDREEVRRLVQQQSDDQRAKSVASGSAVSKQSSKR